MSRLAEVQNIMILSLLELHKEKNFELSCSIKICSFDVPVAKGKRMLSSEIIAQQ